MSRLLWLAGLVISFLASATEFPINEVPPLHQLRLFQSELNPDHFILIGKDGIYGDAGNWYVVDANSGRLTSPKLKRESFYWFSGGFDFKYEDGRWFYFPVSNLQPGALIESIPAGLIDPNTGREPLKAVDVTRENLEQLHLLPLIASEALEGLKRKADYKPEARPIAKSSKVVLITVDYNEKELEDRDLVREFKRKLEDDSERAIYAFQMMGSDNNELMIWAFDYQVETIVQWIKEVIKKSPTVASGSLDYEPIALPATEMNDYYKLSSLNRVLHAQANYSRFELRSHPPSPEEAQKIAVAIHNYIRNIGTYYRTMVQPTHILKHWENSRAARQNYIDKFDSPLRHLMDRGFEILHNLNTPLARDVIFFGPDEGIIPRLDFLTRPVNEGGKTYFENFLEVMENRITWAETATPEELSKSQGRNSSGGLLQEFGFLNVTLRDARSGEAQPTYFSDSAQPWPLLVFGISDSPNYRHQLAKFIVSMDKHAEIQRELLKTNYDSNITGSHSLVRILQYMSWLGDYDKGTAPDASQFSSELYYRQMMEVVTEVLSTARITIVNRATYVGLLDAAVGLQRQVQHRFGVLPENRGLAEALVKMQKVVQVRLMRAVYAKRGAENCEEALLAQ